MNFGGRDALPLPHSQMRRTKKERLGGQTQRGKESRVERGKGTRKIRQNLVGRKRGGKEEGGGLSGKKRKKEVRGKKVFPLSP